MIKRFSRQHTFGGHLRNVNIFHLKVSDKYMKLKSKKKKHYTLANRYIQGMVEIINTQAELVYASL